MKKRLPIYALIGTLLLSAPLPVPAEEPAAETAEASAEDAGTAYRPGLTRAAEEIAFSTAQEVADRYGVGLTDGLPLYTPAEGQPLNAYLIVTDDCMVGIDGDNMYPVSEKGLVSPLSEDLESWASAVTEASGGSIRFVSDPDQAEILVAAAQTYSLYGTYSGGGITASGYSCTVKLSACLLSDPSAAASFSATNTPGSSETTNGGSVFWKAPPEIGGTDKLKEFAEQIQGWYGFSAQKGSSGDGVKRLQQTLIDRGFLADVADGSFGSKTEEAVKLLQENSGLSQTGVVDVETLTSLYYEA